MTERSSTGGQQRPNVVLIITDQHRPDHTGFGGNPVVQTPHLDALAARGVVFERAVVANPICMPNRSTILTGRMPSVHGVRFNGVALDWGANTFVRVLREAGYHTAHIGKAHYQNMGHAPGLGNLFFPQPGDAFRTSWPDGWTTWEDLARHRQGYVELPEDWYGFDHVDLVVDHADRCGGHYYQWLVHQGVDPATIQGPENKRAAADVGWDQIYQPGIPEELYPTTYIGMRAAELVQEVTEPFFLQVSFPDPHHPFTPPGRFYEMYDPRSIPLPPTFDDPHDRSNPAIKQMLRFRGRQAPNLPVAPFACSEEQFREAAAKEYGMITMIDEAVGQLVAALERAGVLGDTVIVFTSDHGDMFGDHGIMLKGGLHYRGCIEVPMVIAGPGVAVGARTSALVGSIDLPETILELCGANRFFGMQGISFAGLLADPTGPGRARLLVEEDQVFDMAGTGRPLRMRTIVTSEARLTRYEGLDHGDLFDLITDGDEMVNLWGETKARSLRAEMTEHLVEELILLADDAPKPTHLA